MNKAETHRHPVSPCDEIQAHTDRDLQASCASKHYVMRPCTACDISDENSNLPIISGTSSDVRVVNTGYDGLGSALPAGTTDSNWEVGQGDTSGPQSVTNWIPAFVVNEKAWTASPFNNAEWISPWPDTEHPTPQKNEDLYFRYRFILDTSIDPQTFSIKMDFFADNNVFEIYINGTAQSQHIASVPQSTTYGHKGFIAGSGATAELSHDWQNCENEIIVHIKSSKRKAGFLAQNSEQCTKFELPPISPLVSVVWGDSKCDCLETDDFEVICVNVCNPYSNVAFKNLTIYGLHLEDEQGNPVPTLPDGTPSVDIHPSGPLCFGDLGPCRCDDHENCQPTCSSRETVIITRGARAGRYRIRIDGICFDLCFEQHVSTCVEFNLCAD